MKFNYLITKLLIVVDMISLGDYQKILKESRFKCWILENFLQPIMHEMANTIRAILQGVFFYWSALKNDHIIARISYGSGT